MRFFTILIIIALITTAVHAQSKKPFRIAVAGLTHTHVHWILDRADDGDIEIVGISEANSDLAKRFLGQHNLPMSLVYPTLSEMLSKTKPEAVAAFGSIYEHLEVVKTCAPLGIHVMVEKPLAVSMEHAKEMAALAKKHKIHLLTNYETTWYASNYEAKKLLPSMGELRKVVVHDGHQGPKEIGCNAEFLEWLTDPKLNGGGALTDFGCYGANLLTWLMNGQKPESIFAVTQQIKPDVYPKVEDEATIIVTYPKAQGIIQASWNWPYNRKDMEVYARNGFMVADKNGLMIKPNPEVEMLKAVVPLLSSPYNDPFAYFAAVVRGEIKMQPSDLSALENNLIVVEILDAARKSAKEGQRIYLK